MFTNIIRYLGVICAALVIGYIVGVTEHRVVGGVQSTVTGIQTTETEKSTTTTETTERPDGSKTTKSVTETERRTSKEDRKESTVPAKERPRQFRTTVAARPEWDSKKQAIKVHPMVVISKRLWDSPVWADIIVDPGRKEGALGISLEW